MVHVTRAQTLRRFAALLLLTTLRVVLGAAPEIRLNDSHLAAGDSTKGTALFDIPEGAKELKLRITAVREVNVPTPKSKSGLIDTVLLEKSVASTGALAMPFEVDTSGMLEGKISVRAELLDSKSNVAALAESAPINVTVRHWLDLNGQWDVTKVDVLDGAMTYRAADWKMGPIPAAITLPGRFPFDDGFRGWVAVKRSFAWKTAAGLSPRFIYLSGVSDSAEVTINGDKMRETTPIEDMALLTHWYEFSSPYKGEENYQKRMWLLDLGVQAPFELPLPKALPTEGQADISMRIRSTSGANAPKPAYGILGALHFEATPATFIKAVTFDTEKPGPARRFKFSVTLFNDSGKPFAGKLRTVYGRYDGKIPYTGACPPYAEAEQNVELPAGESTVEVDRDEMPRFDTCRATFALMNADATLDAVGINFHTVTMEIRDRRDLYLNNERFIVKAQGSQDPDANSRLQMSIKGGNAFRNYRAIQSTEFPDMVSGPDCINSRLADGLLTTVGPSLASVESCTFFNPKDTSNITKTVRFITKPLYDCPGVIIWEATNELYGETDECRIAIQQAYHKLDPYHRPMCATKASGEWEAVAKDGRVAGVDIVGCQYLLSREGIESGMASITEHPLMSTEVNWNDITLHTSGMWKFWLNKGVCGSLFFDYSGIALCQATPLVPPENRDQRYEMVHERDREVYQDLVATAQQTADGHVQLTVGNQMPYALRKVTIGVMNQGRYEISELTPGDAARIELSRDLMLPVKNPVALRCSYETHGGLKHTVILTPILQANVPAEGQKK